jgi:hypothetical protein
LGELKTHVKTTVAEGLNLVPLLGDVKVGG